MPDPGFPADVATSSSIRRVPDEPRRDGFAWEGDEGAMRQGWPEDAGHRRITPTPRSSAMGGIGGMNPIRPTCCTRSGTPSWVTAKLCVLAI